MKRNLRQLSSQKTFSWVHTFDPNTLLTVLPFYHYNGADYQGGPNDVPVISSVTQTAQYAGAQVALNANFWRNDIQAGVYGFFQHQYNHFFNNYTVPNSPPNVLSSIGVNGGVAIYWPVAISLNTTASSPIAVIPSERFWRESRVLRVPACHRRLCCRSIADAKRLWHSYLLKAKSNFVSPLTVTGLDSFFAPSCQATTV